MSAVEIETPVSAFPGIGEYGIEAGMAADVLKDHSPPCVSPAAFFAVTRQ
jgi:hypothetical protein